MKTSRTTLILGSSLCSLLAHPALAQPPQAIVAQGSQDLSRLSIEELAQLPVRSASKRDEPLSAAPSALYVITGEEILASAAQTLPEALRLAPNLNVQQVDAAQYAITARGFNSIETANKLLVLIDGRTVYTPLASTVFWELHNRPVEDIRQIEVISGPGGTLYGPNAVNGVVNVVTRDARDTLGGIARGAVGEQERSFVARYGAPLGPTGAIRFYGHWFDREDLPQGAGANGDDRFRGWQAGFRADLAPGRDHITVQGDIFDNDLPNVLGAGNHGHNLLARWTRTLDGGSAIQVQAYYDYFARDNLLVRDSLQTFDVEALYNARFGAHDLVAGAGLRTTRDSFVNNLNAFQLVPSHRRLWVYNAFVQDRIALSDSFALTLGLKAEQTTFTGVELLPNVRLAWQPNERTLFWGAVSRALRTPSRIDRQLQALPLLAPSTQFESEELIAFEAGYRGQPIEGATLSVSVFYNVYDDIRTTEFTGNPLPIRLLNGLRGESYGMEAWGGLQLRPGWRLSLGLSTLWKDFELEPGRVDLANRDALGHDPEYQLFARSQISLTDRLELNVGLRWIGDIEAQPGIGSYVEADARLGFRLTDEVELYLAGSNLLHRTHAESDDDQRAQLAERSILAGARVRF